MGYLSSKIYPKLPLFIQNIGISLFGIKWNLRRFGGIYSKEYSAFKNRESFDELSWENYKEHQLRAMLLHAFNHVPYYHELFKANGFDELKLQSFQLKDLNKIPLLDKQILRTLGQSSLLATIKEKGGEFFSSSGSSGTPTQILFSKHMHQRYAAAHEARCRNWSGVTRKDSRGMIGGRRVLPNASDGPPYYRYNLVEKQVYFSAYHISKNSVKNYVDGMIKYGIQYMNGYAVSNFVLAKFIKEAGLKAPKLKAVITSSEKLTPEMRKLMEEVYQCKTFDGWSGVEACAMVTECEHGSLHISEDVGIIEILDELGQEVADGESGEVVCTGFLNYDQPLIRYRIGDRMTKGKGTCACGRNMPIIQDIEGRIEDVIIGPDGRQMVRFHGIFVGIPAIEKAQVIQHSLHEIELKIENTVALQEEEISLMKQRIVSQLGEVQVVVNQQTIIPQTANGKYKAVISLLKKTILVFLKILFLTQYFPPETGAPQNRIHSLATYLADLGADVSVLTAMPNYPKMEIQDAYKGRYFVKEQDGKLNIFRSWIFVKKVKALWPDC